MISKEIHNSIIEHTQLDDLGAIVYGIFCFEANLSEPNIVMWEGVKTKLTELYEELEVEFPDKDKLYLFWFEELYKKDLLAAYQTDNKTIYPRIKGYNFLNDPKLYVATRKKGDTQWTGRIPKESLNDPITNYLYRHLDMDYEFREDWINEKIISLKN